MDQFLNLVSRYVQVFRAADSRKAAVQKHGVTIGLQQELVFRVNPEIAEGVQITAPAYCKIFESRPQKGMFGDSFLYVSEINKNLTAMWERVSAGSIKGSIITGRIHGWNRKGEGVYWPKEKDSKSFSNVASEPPTFFCCEDSDKLFLIDRNNWTTSKESRLIAHYANAKASLPWLLPENDDDLFGLRLAD